MYHYMRSQRDDREIINRLDDLLDD